MVVVGGVVLGVGGVGGDFLRLFLQTKKPMTAAGRARLMRIVRKGEPFLGEGVTTILGEGEGRRDGDGDRKRLPALVDMGEREGRGEGRVIKGWPLVLVVEVDVVVVVALPPAMAEASLEKGLDPQLLEAEMTK